MSDPTQREAVSPDSEKAPVAGRGGPAVAATLAEGGEIKLSTAGVEADLKALTPEEQMALYENDLKENDWGHQPC